MYIILLAVGVKAHRLIDARVERRQSQSRPRATVDTTDTGPDTVRHTAPSLYHGVGSAHSDDWALVTSLQYSR